MSIAMIPTADTEIRHLLPSVREHLARQFLDVQDNWKRLAGKIPISSTDSDPLYTNEEIAVFSHIKRGSPAIKLLDDWGSKGRQRPTIKLLIDCLLKSDQYGAACYIAVNVLKGQAPERPSHGPGIKVHLPTEFGNGGATSGTAFQTQIPTAPSSDEVHSVSIPPVAPVHLPQNMAVPHVPFESLFKCTLAFSQDRKLGQGAFGAVYLGHLDVNGEKIKVAVKKLRIGEERQFNTEIRVMTRYVHEHLLEILGFSCDNPGARCLICALMVNGSLEDRLALKNNTPALPWNVRIDIAIGTAKGLIALHTMYDEPLVHRDIKSANILLDEHFVAKIGDFGIARLGGDWQNTTGLITSQWCGTPVYMAEEALRGSITVKLDTFSFGVVLLELLTGLPPFDGERSEPALVSYVEEEDKAAQEWSDPSAGHWPPIVANNLLDIANRCNEGKKKIRPLIQDVLPQLEALK